MLTTRPVLLSSLGVEIRILLRIAIRTHTCGVALFARLTQPHQAIRPRTCGYTGRAGAAHGLPLPQSAHLTVITQAIDRLHTRLHFPRVTSFTPEGVSFGFLFGFLDALLRNTA